jgi:LmbE family N-acetylglucosaminyl deacetylase
MLSGVEAPFSGHRRIVFCLLLIFIFFPLVLKAQSNNLVLLCLAAHPDDEDNATLAYYVKTKGIRAYTIYYTRGEGGQNEIGPELYDELGKIREQECYQAGEVQGSTPFFLGFLDFGYSKTAKETFKFWGGKDSVLERLVYMIRVLRPDVIITNHDTITTKPKRQHGNHQVVGITAYEAFDKAADLNYHPEQLINGITLWQVKKLFFRVYDSTKTSGVVTIPIHEKDPASGKTIEDISFEAIAKHRTQGMDKIVRTNLSSITGERVYKLILSDKNYPYDASDLFSGIQSDITTKPVIPPQSYNTVYTYRKLNSEDSLRILESVKYNENTSIGLIKTYDNTIENILNAFHIKYHSLDSSSIANGVFHSFQTIILDIRAYFYRQDLIKSNYRLIEFVKQGGNLICFYNKPAEWNNNNYSPYPIYLTSERVTEENAPVKILRQHHYFFTPNKIVNDDWNGWIQERSIYLASNDTNLTSSKYMRLLDMDDEGEDQPPTSILCTQYGSGTYTYVALALYRQLKIFNPGALKLFMNMIQWHDPIENIK